MGAMARNDKVDRKHQHLHSTLVVYFPMFIATLSVVSSIYQAILFTRSLDIVQQNVSRGEYLRTCREVIDTYFQIKLSVAQLSESSGAAARADRANAVSLTGKFGALGTYLANFQDEDIRARYTELANELSAIAAAQPATNASQRFEKADRLFTKMNDDCVRLAQVVRM
jgi:hypothetical protein